MTAPVAIFYTPHADDEVLGMGGAIAEAKAAGARIVLVLVTDNLPSERARDLFNDRLRCHWHNKNKHALGDMDLAAARMLEFLDAASRLGADEVAALGIPEQLGVEDYLHYVQTIGASLRRYAVQYPEAEHHVVSGASDPNAETGRSNLSHRALNDAALSVYLPRLVRHRVYVYSLPLFQRLAPVIRHLSPAIMAAKRYALEAYTFYDPANGRLAYGYHSVRGLFDAAAADAREFEEAA